MRPRCTDSTFASLPDAVIVDTHTHVIARDEARYPLQPSGVGSQWFRDAPCTAEQLAALGADAGVDAAVLVQAFGAYSYDNAYVVDSADVRPDRFVSIAIVDPLDPRSPALLRDLAQRPRFTGVRLFSIGVLDQPQPTWLDDPETFAVWEVCADLGLRVVVACLPEHLPRLSRVLDRFPEQPVVLDHCGFVEAADFDADLLPLSRHANLHCKATSHVLEAAEAQGSATVVVARLVAEFGAERIVWGSDFPQTHDRPYADLVALARRTCSDLSERDRDLVLGGTAARLWPELAA
jgi:predicted TIM-barrel fold metal-dependent hydrolase